MPESGSSSVSVLGEVLLVPVGRVLPDVEEVKWIVECVIDAHWKSEIIITQIDGTTDDHAPSLVELIDKNFLFVRSSIGNAVLYIKKI